jgi:hypothetical protein
MMIRLLACTGFATLLLLGGCVSAPVDAPYYARIAEFEDTEVPWQGCRRDQNTGELQNPNCLQSNPVIFRMDARVFDARTELPMNNVRIWFTSPFNRIYLLPQEVLEAIELPESNPDSGWTVATEDQQELWAEFAGTFEDDYRPTYHEGYTDNNGTATVWVFVEEMPLNEQGLALETGIGVGIASMTTLAPLKATE